jgi:hypothetical protein
MTKPKTLKIDDVEFVRKDEVNEVDKGLIESLKSGKCIAETMIGKYCIVRSRNEGINAGTVLAADDTGVVLTNARRIWYHRPAEKKHCWYEGVSISGLDASSKVSDTVSTKVIIEDYSLTECTEIARLSIVKKVPHAQG